MTLTTIQRSSECPNSAREFFGLKCPELSASHTKKFHYGGVGWAAGPVPPSVVLSPVLLPLVRLQREP